MAWNPGQKLFGGRYIIEILLGEGGIGITYLAKNQRGELRVIKTIREQILNHPAWIAHQDKLRQDFRDEALRLALCRHPHIVQVENVFDEGNLPCMVMEFIKGEDLGERITQRGALPEAEALVYIRQIGDALTLVHERGLLHRDLKPNNIMIRSPLAPRRSGGGGDAVLIDFGIARQFIPGAIQAHTQNLTPGYAPPEQYVPDAERGEFIDVYALAATLYALLSGHLPMPAPARLQNLALKPPQELNPNISDRVNAAIMRGMALNYKFRPQSVQEWLDLLGANVGVGFGTIPHTQPITPNPQPPLQIPKSPTPVVGVSQNWQCVYTLKGDFSYINSVAISPNGQTLAIAGNGKTIKLRELSTGREIRTLTGHSGWFYQVVQSVTITPDGQTLASGSWDNTIKIWELSTGREIHTLTGHSDYIISVAISPDGQALASGSWDNTIKLWKLSTGRNIRTLTGHSNKVNSVTFSPEGQTLASGSDDNTIKLWELSTGREIRTLTGHSDFVRSVAISSDGQILASASRDKTIKLWELITGREICTLTGHSNKVNSVTFSQDRQMLVSGDGDGTIKIWRRG